MEKRRLLLGLMAAFFLATSTLGFVVSLGTPSEQSSFSYEGTCVGTIKEITDRYWLVYTLKDVNIPGERRGPFIQTVPTEDVKKVVEELNLLYWRHAILEVNVNELRISMEGFVLPDRNVGDTVLLDCSVAVSGGRLVVGTAIERVA